MVDEIRTPRLILRTWRDEDAEPFAALNADPEVMEHFPAQLTRAESDAMIGDAVDTRARSIAGHQSTPASTSRADVTASP